MRLLIAFWNERLLKVYTERFFFLNFGLLLETSGMYGDWWKNKE